MDVNDSLEQKSPPDASSSRLYSMGLAATFQTPKTLQKGMRFHSVTAMALASSPQSRLLGPCKRVYFAQSSSEPHGIVKFVVPSLNAHSNQRCTD